MKEFVNTIIENIQIFAQNSNPIIVIMMASTIIILESIIPVLPLALFIAINMIVLGVIPGFLISWISTVIGCVLSFMIFRKGLSSYFYGKFGNVPGAIKIANKINKMNFSTLVIITALPFTPAFSINIAAGLSKMSYRKFIMAMLIAKVSIVYFWGFIGKSLLESITDINTIMKLGVILLLGYLVSTLVRKKFNIE